MKTIEDMVKLLKWIEATHFHGGSVEFILELRRLEKFGCSKLPNPPVSSNMASWKIPELNFIAGKIIYSIYICVYLGTDTYL